MKTTPKGRAKSALLQYFATVESATRQEALDGAMRAYSADGNVDLLAQSNRYATLRSYLGATLSDLIRSGEVMRGGRGYCLAHSTEVVVLRSEVERKMRTILRRRECTLPTLVSAIQRLFGTDATGSKTDDALLRDTVQSVLCEMCERGDVVQLDNTYSWRTAACAPTHPMDFDSFRLCFFDYLSQQGGPAFEVYVAGLLEKFYMMRGTEVLVCETTGGSADGGIDVELHTRDALGFTDRVLIQTKCRSKGHVTEKEVREFYGAMCAKQGSRGLYVTTSNFHPSARKFLNAVDRIVGIDGEMLLRMAVETAYGIRVTKSGYRIDTTIFE